MASDDEAILSPICDTESQPGQGASKSFSAPGGSKVMFEGKEYDYVFDIDADNGLMLKLPYNLNDNPWQAAQDFIHKNVQPFNLPLLLSWLYIWAFLSCSVFDPSFLQMVSDSWFAELEFGCQLALGASCFIVDSFDEFFS